MESYVHQHAYFRGTAQAHSQTLPVSKTRYMPHALCKRRKPAVHAFTNPAAHQRWQATYSHHQPHPAACQSHRNRTEIAQICAPPCCALKGGAPRSQIWRTCCRRHSPSAPGLSSSRGCRPALPPPLPQLRRRWLAGTGW